jgi:hypothetical protein
VTEVPDLGEGDVIPSTEYCDLPEKDSGKRQDFEKNPSKGMKGMTATKHKRVKVGNKTYPAKSMRVMF